MATRLPRADRERGVSDLPALAGAIPVRLREHVAARPDRGLRDIAARGEHRLPPEDELSRLVAVSRPTVRSAPQTLQEEGRVRRVRGRQRFVNRHSLELRANPAEDRSFLDLLERLGLVVDTRTLGVFEIALPLDVIDSLGLAAGATGVPVDRVFEASGAPAVLSVDQAPRELFPGAVAELEAGSSTFELVRANSSQRIRYSVAELRPRPPGCAHRRAACRRPPPRAAPAAPCACRRVRAAAARDHGARERPLPALLDRAHLPRRMTLELTLACGDYDRTWPLVDGRVRPEGMELQHHPPRARGVLLEDAP